MHPAARTARLLTGLTLAGLTLAGCGSSSTGSSSSPSSVASATASDSSPSASSSSPSATDSSPTAADPDASSSASSSSATPALARCTTPDLRFSLSRGDGAAGSVYYLLRMTNRSATSCRTSGFGGVSFVARPDGAPIGAPADRTQRDKVRPLVLEPGQHAEATLRETSPENYSTSDCRPRAATGLRVYPPDETRSAFVRQRGRACASTSVHLLELTPYTRTG